MALTKLLALALATAVIYAAPTSAATKPGWPIPEHTDGCAKGSGPTVHQQNHNGREPSSLDRGTGDFEVHEFETILEARFGTDSNADQQKQVCVDLICELISNPPTGNSTFWTSGGYHKNATSATPTRQIINFPDETYCPPQTLLKYSDNQAMINKMCLLPSYHVMAFDPSEWTVFAMWHDYSTCFALATSNKDPRFVDGPPSYQAFSGNDDDDAYQQCPHSHAITCAPVAPPAKAPYLFWKQKCSEYACPAGVTPKTTTRRCERTECTDAECCE
jgi:hypothetical protein